MVFSWLSPGSEDVAVLIAKKSYGRAAKLIRTQIEKDPGNVSLELQLADVLQLDGKGAEAVTILLGVADEYARNGFLAKAIALLKKVQRIDPESGAEMDRKIAGLAKERDGESIRRTAAREAMQVRPRPAGAPARAPEVPKPVPVPEPDEPARPPARRIVIDIPLPSFEPPVALTPPSPPPAALAAPERVPAPAPVTPEARRPATPPPPAVERVPPREARGETGLERTPLFSDFSGDELVEVIRGLRLLTFEPGDVVVAEGEPGDSLFVLTTGSVKAFCKDPRGKYHMVREMNEGSFFGEISILTGMPRTATITAVTPLEILELDHDTLAAIALKHPRVQTVLEEFCRARAGSLDELRVRMGRTGPPPPS